MSCNATAGDKNNLHKGHYSTRVLAPTGGGTTSISLGGGYGGGQPKRSNQQRGVRRGPQGVTNQNKTTMSMGGVGQAKPRQGGVRRNVTKPKGAAGGSASLSNSGGYGNLDIHSKASSRVLAQPGGGSSNIFGGPQTNTKRGGTKPTQRGGGRGQQQKSGGGRGQQQRSGGRGQQQRSGGGRGQQQRSGGRGQQQRSGGARGRGAAGGSGALSNSGGYGNLDIHSKPSSRVLSQPGGGSSNIFGGGSERKTKSMNQSQKRAKESLQSNVFGAPSQSQSKGKKVSRQPGGGQSTGGSQRKGVRVGQQPGGGQSQSRGQKASTRVINPTGGGSSVRLGGSGRGQIKSSTRVTNKGQSQGIFQPGSGRGQKSSTRVNNKGQSGGIFGPQGSGRGQPKKTGVRRGPQTVNRGAAGGSGGLSNSGGYGNLDIHSKPSTRVHAPPGGRSNMPF